MLVAPPRVDEAQSLAALQALDVLDSGPEAEFDALVRAASLSCHTPISLISLIDAERQWFKAHIGLPGVTQTPRDAAFCAHAVLTDELMEVPDARLDPRFADNPLVTGAPGIRFYAGAPLRLSSGHRVGTLCIIDRQPRQLSEAQREVLRCLAVAAALALEGRQASRALRQAVREDMSERIQARQAANELLNAVRGQFIVSITDASGTIIEANDAFCAISQYSRSELIGANHRVINSASHPRAFFAAMWQRIAAGLPWRGDICNRARDGSLYWVDSVIVPLRDSDGRIDRFVSIRSDITARKQLERQWVDNQRFLRQVIDNVPALIAHIGLDRRYTMVNHAYMAWDHRNSQDIVGHTVQEIQGPQDYALLAPQLERALTGQAVSFEVELRRGGESRAMQVTYEPDLDSAGCVVGVYSFKVDVTALRRAEEKLRLVMEASPQGMFTSDLEGNCTYANAAWQGIAGLTPEQSLGVGMRSIMHPDDVAAVMAKQQTALEEGGVQTSEYRYVRPDGKTVWVRGHMAVLHNEREPDCIVGTVEDVTERRLIDEELADKSAALTRSNLDLERFAYVASHDLQEPLRMVTSYGQLLMRRHSAQLNPEAQEFLHFMVDGGQRAQALIRDLLSLARLDSQAKPMRPVKLDDVLADCLRHLRGVLGEAGATITHDALPTVMADNSQMGQLLTNLISNAVKFHGAAPPVVHISAEHEGGCWRVSVRDNGIGIEPKFFERVFVMFQRLNLRAHYEGTGIGLAICKRVVERHGGRIGVASEPGQGATFFFTLPDLAPGAQAPSGQGPKP